MAEYEKSFDETFEEVGAGWLSKGGKSYNLKVKASIPAGANLLLLKNTPKSENGPVLRLFIRKEDGSLTNGVGGAAEGEKKEDFTLF